MERVEPQVTQPELPQLGTDLIPTEVTEPRIDLTQKFKPSQVPKLEDGSIDIQREMLRRQVAGVYEVDTTNPEELTAFSREYLKQLSDDRNRYHFTAIPHSIEDMMELLDQPQNHGLAVYNVLGEVVGFATIEDAARDQRDNWMNKVVVVWNLQNKKRGEDRPQGVGKKVIEKVVDWTFDTEAYDGRQRKNLYAAVVLMVHNDKRMYDVLEGVGFQYIGGNAEQATITLPNGMTEDLPTARFVMREDNWSNRRYVKQHQGEHQLQEGTTINIGPN